MKNMIGYIKATADKTFFQKPFCEGDSLVLSQLVYLDFGPYMEKAAAPTLGGAAAAGETPYPGGKEWKKLRAAVAKSRRFSPIVLRHFVQKLDEEKEEQFAAVTYLLPFGIRYVAFRGTDNTLVGWKEDFNMTFLPVVPAQLESAAYLHEEAARGDGPLLTGGHSKGGNLAVYAASRAPQEVKSRLRAVYNHDGPGFREIFYQEPGYDEIVSRLNTTIPKASLIGRLACRDEGYRIVAGKGFGPMQHEPFRWGYTKEGLRYEERPAKNALFLSKTFNDWFCKIDAPQRAVFIDTLYELVENTGVKSLNEAQKRWLPTATAALSAYQKLDEESKGFIQELLSLLWNTAKSNLKADEKAQKKAARKEKSAKKAEQKS